MYIPSSRYSRSRATHTSADRGSLVDTHRNVDVGTTTMDAHVRLVRCAVLLHLAFSAASLVAFGVLDLIAPDGGAAWVAVLAIVCGGSAACVLWRWAGRAIDRDVHLSGVENDHGPAAR